MLLRNIIIVGNYNTNKQHVIRIFRLSSRIKQSSVDKLGAMQQLAGARACVAAIKTGFEPE
jgi:hypothetical protein